MINVLDRIPNLLTRGVEAATVVLLGAAVGHFFTWLDTDFRRPEAQRAFELQSSLYGAVLAAIGYIFVRIATWKELFLDSPPR